MELFNADVYANRRKRLKEKITTGLGVFMGNDDSPMNYPGNIYHYRQDSSFLYFFGLDMPGLAGVINFETGEEFIFGDDVSLDDIIWMGPQPSMKELAAKVGISQTKPFNQLEKALAEAKSKNSPLHFLPQYRGEAVMKVADLLHIGHNQVKDLTSEQLIKAVVELRSIKDAHEIEELKKAAAIGYQMHTTAMKMSKPGVYEREIAGVIEGIALSGGGMLSFPVILTQHGETLHNHYHGNKLEKGKLMLTDAGAETPMHYASDFTRTVPVGGKFSERQKDIYNIVLAANNKATSMIKPGIKYFDIHVEAATVLASGLKDLGIMKGDPAEAARTGAYALFQPHGLGHMMGLDVHDMEGLGENYVGYDENTKRSDKFGLGGLRLGRELQPGFVLTNEPGCYFIPELISKWEGEKKFADFINYDKVKEYIDFGGIRLEDDILVTENGHELLGDRIPITVDEIEKQMNG
ncbi:MAG: aminopeptidase P family protein [Bacteroidales bacterium]